MVNARAYEHELLDDWARLPDGWNLLDVCGISIDEQDNVYVLNRGTYPVIVFDQSGNVVRYWGKGCFKRPHGCCISPAGEIYCTDDSRHVVYKFTMDGQLLLELGKKDQHSDTGYVFNPELSVAAGLAMINQAGPPFNRPTGVSVDRDGNIYVSDGYGNARIHKFSPKGELLFSWGEPGIKPGQFRLPHSVRAHPDGSVWVADRENGRIQIFDSRGRFQGEWADLLRPTDICFDKQGMVYVSELRGRLSIFSPDGKPLSRSTRRM